MSEAGFGGVPLCSGELGEMQALELLPRKGKFVPQSSINVEKMCMQSSIKCR